MKVNRRITKIIGIAALSALYTASATFKTQAQSNDLIFPAAPVAKKNIDFDARGFLINGKPTFLVSAGMEYARIPRELWQDRLLRLKRAGFNCIEIYTFWNYHEPHEGKFDFTGNRDLNAFLKTVKNLGMYSIVRVGPYYCGEWDSGGYPIWLRFKENTIVRSPNANFENYVDRFFDHLLPVVMNNQINHGGSVILVQLENEHPLAWGTFTPNPYFEHLKQKALSLGLQVPYFFSGLHHGADPAGNKPTLDDERRPNPWFTTEFWSVWYNLYGSTQKDADTYGRRTWKIIAKGGNGYNYYMAHGGTNFDYSFSHEDAASYDYGAAVGQTGDLRPIYYQFKRNAFFARSFENILENSINSNAYKDMVADTGITVSARHGDAGDILFFDHAAGGFAPLLLQVPGSTVKTKFDLAPGEIMPIVHNFPIANGIKMDWCMARVLGISKNDRASTLVIYGPEGSAADVVFSAGDHFQIIKGSGSIKTNGEKVFVHAEFKKDRPLMYGFESNGHKVSILALTTALADRTWFVEHQNKNYVITGPEYVGEIQTTPKNQLAINIEHFWEQPQTLPTWLYIDGEVRMSSRKPGTVTTTSFSKFTDKWQEKNASEPAEIKFDDSHWKKSKHALEMGADDDLTANAWYRTNINIQQTGTYRLNISRGGGRFIVFIDSKRVADGGMDNLQFEIAKGHHLMSIYAAHDGRDKLYNFTGNLQNIDTKGISGDVFLQRGPAFFVTGWKMVSAPNNNPGNDDVHFPSFLNARSYEPGARSNGNDNLLNRGYAWFQAKLPVNKDHLPVQFNFKGLTNNAKVFINGEYAAHKSDNGVLTVKNEFSKPTDPYLTISVLAENRAGQNNRGVVGAISKPVEIIYNDDLQLTDWSMKGGPGDTTAQGWKNPANGGSLDRPYFYKNIFQVNNGGINQHPMWRVSYEGLSHGFIFVNGHNIGGYPERVPVKSLYIPECWLHKGNNEIMIYDQYGNRPDKTTISPELRSSRTSDKIIL